MRTWNVDRVKDGSYGSTSELVENLRPYKGRIGIFHFAGHAMGKNLVFANASQKNDELHIGNLANFLKDEPHLALVFLNACATAPMVQYLLDLGIKAVIATNEKILDKEASEFAKHFYEELVQGQTLQGAFINARSAVRGGEPAEGYLCDSNQLVLEDDQFPWGLYYRSKQKTVLDWQLSHLDSLPPLTPTDITAPQYFSLTALRQALNGKTVIGVTGHRDLLPEDTGYMRRQEGRLEKTVKEKLKELMNAYGKEKLVLLSPLAQGADQLVAWTAMQLGIPVYAPIPMALGFYEKDFHRTQKNENRDTSKELMIFRYLLGKTKGCYLVSSPKEKTGAERDRQYEAVGKFVAQHSDVLLALWDGVETAKTGGTSEIVKMVCTGIDRQGLPFTGKDHLQVLHLLIPRLKNRFPLRSRFSDYTYNSTNIGTKYGWEKLLLKPVDWSEHRSRIFSVIGFFKAPYFRQLVLPLVLALITLILGTVGFYEYHQKASEEASSGVNAINGYNAFFKAAGLLIIDTSVIERRPELAPWTLEIARVTGVVFIVLAFVLAFIYNFREQRILLKIALWARFNKKFVLVCGLGGRGQAIVSDLRRQKIRVVAIEKNTDNAYRDFCDRVGAKLVVGDANAVEMLEKTRFYKAKEIYMVTDVDAVNIAIFQKMDQWLLRHSEDGQREKISCYIHIDDYRQRSFLDRTLQNKSRLWLRPFKVYESTARRMVTGYPVDRFNDNPKADTAQLLIFGYNELAEELILAHLRLGHFMSGKKLRIRVFTPEPEKRQAAFEAAYPCTVRNQGVFKEPGLASIQEYTFFRGTKDNTIVDFQPLPLSDLALLNEDAIYGPIRNSHIVNLYVCLDDGFHSTTLLSTLLPKLESLRQDRKCDLQVFCYSHRLNGQYYMEKNPCRLPTTLPIHFFGNFHEHGATAAIKAEEQDQLARLNGLWYYFMSDRNNERDNSIQALEQELEENLSNSDLLKDLAHSKTIATDTTEGMQGKIHCFGKLWSRENAHLLYNLADTRWEMVPEGYRDSDRLAADHMGCKLRSIGYKIVHNQGAMGPEALKDSWRKVEDTIGQLAELEHRRWCAEKLLEGFIPFEGTKEMWVQNKKLYQQQKQHVCLQAYESLDDKERIKDYSQLFGLIYILAVQGKGLQKNGKPQITPLGL